MKTPVKSTKSRLPTLVAMALFVSSAGIIPAMADDCTDMIDQVTVALNSANISAEDATKVEAARATAINKQQAGDANGCVSELVEARAILNLE